MILMDSGQAKKIDPPSFSLWTSSPLLINLLQCGKAVSRRRIVRPRTSNRAPQAVRRAPVPQNGGFFDFWPSFSSLWRS